MKISYLITTSDETRTLDSLLDTLCSYVDLSEDEMVILIDSDCKKNNQTRIIIDNYKIKYPQIKIHEHSLEKSYSNHKNHGATLCSGKFIFQIDADERPTETLLINIKDIIESNPGIEAFWIPRVNAFVGVHDLIARGWGWRLSPSTDYTFTRQFNKSDYEYQFLYINKYIIQETENKKSDISLTEPPKELTVKHKAVLVNAYDPQCRLFLNEPKRIKWEGRLHERINGNSNHVYLPMSEELALYHDKSIEKQLSTNKRYNEVFTQEENKGFTLPK